MNIDADAGVSSGIRHLPTGYGDVGVVFLHHPVKGADVSAVRTLHDELKRLGVSEENRTEYGDEQCEPQFAGPVKTDLGDL